MIDRFEQIPELESLQSGRDLIRIPAEQNVPLTPRVRALIDTPEFQRLAEISQLGLVARVYPGARHTRFEHALGVYHNALRYLQQLQHDARFRAAVTPHQGTVLIAAALLHDLGHWPFCHPIEDLGLPNLPPHEAHAAAYLGDDSELSRILRSDWGIEPAEVLDLLVKRTQAPAQKLLRSILSGPIDVDKMDYLDRDSLHCGVPYGRNFDKQRLIQSLVLNQRGDGLALNAKGKTAAELMVFARYVMFSEVYWHHAVRVATSMFARVFYEFHRQFDWRSLFQSTDSEMIGTLRQAAAGTVWAPLLEGVFGRRRRLYKRAAEFSFGGDPELYRRIAGRPYEQLVELAGRVVVELQRRTRLNVPVEAVLIDAPPPHREVEFAIDIYFPKTGEFRPLKQVSPVVEALARTQFDDWVKQVRIFVAPEWQRRISAEQWRDVLEAVS